MNIEIISQKKGQHWTPEEIETVFDWLEREVLANLIQFAYGFTKRGLDQERALELAKDVVAAKLKDAFHTLHTYDPTRYRGKRSPFMNWIYYMVARAAVRRAQQEMRRRARETDLDKVRPRNWQIPLTRSEPKIDWEEAQPFINQLPPKYKEAMDLCDNQGMSRKEAAQKSRWPCSGGAMKVRLCRAHQELHRLMRFWSEADHYIDQLPPDYRQAIILCDQRGLVPGEAARIAGCSAQDMEDRLPHARLELRRLMKEGGNFP